MKKNYRRYDVLYLFSLKNDKIQAEIRKMYTTSITEIRKYDSYSVDDRNFQGRAYNVAIS